MGRHQVPGPNLLHGRAGCHPVSPIVNGIHLLENLRLEEDLADAHCPLPSGGSTR